MLSNYEKKLKTKSSFVPKNVDLFWGSIRYVFDVRAASDNKEKLAHRSGHLNKYVTQ